MLLGCHLSIAGGLEKAIEQAESLDINALQIFSRNARTWKITHLKPEQIEIFRKAWTASRVEYIVIHTSYLINLASPKEDVYQKSIEALKDEILRAGQLGIPHVNTHVGEHLQSGIDAGLTRIACALDEVFQSSEAKNFPEVQVLLENDAGSGSALGVRFEELGRIIDNVRHSERLSVCFDTCHGFAAGYDFTSKEGLTAMLKEFDDKIGLDRLKLIHVNDSKHPLGSRRDRHEHIGQGYLGREAFELIVNHPQLRDLPFVLETPKAADEEDKLNSDMDIINLNRVRSLRREQ